MSMPVSAGGGVAFHPFAPGLFGPRHFRALVSGFGPDKILYGQRLRHLDAEVADRQVHGIREFPPMSPQETRFGFVGWRRKIKIVLVSNCCTPLRHLMSIAQKKKIRAGGGYAHLPEAVHARRGDCP